MALKRKIENQAEIPAGFETSYIERDGAWHLDVEADARLEEMRQSAIAANKRAKEIEERFSGIDLEAFRKLEAEKKRLEDEQRIKEGKVADVIAEHVRKAVEPERAARVAAEGQLASVLIDNQAVMEATKRGVRPTAVPDLTARARSVFRLVDGKPRAVGADGNPLMGKGGTAPMTLAEWVESLGTEAPHLFEANAGGGAAGSGSGGAGSGGGVANPYRTGAGWNFTEQSRLEKTNPALAARLKAAAE